MTTSTQFDGFDVTPMTFHDRTRGYRFELDKLCKSARIEELEDAFGAGFHGTTIPADNNKLHSVFTTDLRDDNGNFRHRELQTLIGYLQARI